MGHSAQIRLGEKMLTGANHILGKTTARLQGSPFSLAPIELARSGKSSTLGKTKAKKKEEK